MVATLVTERTGARAVGVVMYDPDMEALSSRYWFGEGKKNLSVVGEPFCEEFEESSTQTSEINFDDLDVFAA